jgi:predicted PurR-regulated permease PerM
MPPRSPFPLFSTPSDARTAALQGLLITALVITGLYVGRDVLLPLALSILLAFVLTPPLLLLRRIKVPRVLAVVTVVTVAFAIIFALGWLLSREVTHLAGQLPTYRDALSAKIVVLRESTQSSPVFQQAGEILSDLQNQLVQPDKGPAAPEVGAEADRPDDKPIKVEVLERPATTLEFYQRIAGTLLPPLATAGIVLLFVVVILLQREDLRDRFIRLAGASDMQRATTTLNDAAHRLSRYFLSQLLINSAYGVFMTAALWAIGIPNPIIWGILAALMRFVPFIGSYIAAIPPLLLALVVDDGWSTFFLTLALFIVAEMTMGQVVEPLVFGRGTGVSPIAVIAATIFWTWLWGPLGLLLATPLTVCLAVLGRHVEGLRFFEVLLGDQPALTPAQSFYQRTLSGDAAEATYQAELCLKEEKTLQSYLDAVAIEGLKLAQQDAERGLLDSDQAERMNATVREMLDNLSVFEPRRWFPSLRRKVEKDDKDAEAAGGLASLEAPDEDEDGSLPVIERHELAPGWVVDEPILTIGGRSDLDEAAASMLAEVLKKRGLNAKAHPVEAISAGHIASLHGTEAKLVCLNYLGLGSGPAHIRYVVRRLRRILPDGTHILVAFFADEEDEEFVKALRETAEADAYATSLAEAVEHCVKAARGELNGKPVEPQDEVKIEAKVEASAPPKPEKPRKKAPAPAA